MHTSEHSATERLFSLDALRGLDMILLTVIGPLVFSAQKCWGLFPEGFMQQFKHGWECFTLWDIIMPLFIFMCGAAVPFALERRLKEGKGVFWRHVLWRFAMLWALGGLVQGKWHTLDTLQMSPFSNTLQAIAIGYLAVAAAMHFGSRALMLAAPVAMAAAYTALLAFGGDYGKFSNMAFKIDHAILKSLLPAASTWVSKPSHYTWFATSLMFAAMTFAGYHAMKMLLSPFGKWRKAGLLAAYGAALLAVGFVSEIWIPCIKPIFTLSFSAQAMGWCVLSLAALYVVADIWNFRPCSPAVLLFGRMALSAYFISHFFSPVLKATANLLGGGLASLVPESAAGFVISVVETACLVLAMLMWRRARAV